MKFLGSSKKGQSFAWLLAIMMFFVVGALFIILDSVMGKIVLGNVGAEIVGTQFEATGNKVNFMWSYFPVVVVFVVLIWMVIQALRRPDTL